MNSTYCHISSVNGTNLLDELRSLIFVGNRKLTTTILYNVNQRKMLSKGTNNALSYLYQCVIDLCSVQINNAEKKKNKNSLFALFTTFRGQCLMVVIIKNSISMLQILRIRVFTRVPFIFEKPIFHNVATNSSLFNSNVNAT